MQKHSARVDVGDYALSVDVGVETGKVLLELMIRERNRRDAVELNGEGTRRVHLEDPDCRFLNSLALARELQRLGHFI
ncbi:hypothetical protein D3C83_210150 [compost metagenome]